MSGEAVEYVWEEKGVKVHIPPQSEAVEIKEKSFGNPSNTAIFTLVRGLVNFEVVIAGTTTHVNSFDPAMEIIVGKNSGEEKLAYWKNSAWHLLSTESVSSPFDDFVYAEQAEVSFKWDDPAMAWGT